MPVRRPLGLAAVILAVAAGGRLSAQTVRGQVTAAPTGSPVASVLVELLDSRGREAARAQSSAAGEYIIAAPASGTYHLRFSLPGYRPLVSPSFALVADQTVEYPLHLTAVAPELLDTLIVEGHPVPAYLRDFYRRRRMGEGRYLVRDEIEASSAQDVSGLVRRSNVLDVGGDPGDGGGRRVGSRSRALGGGFCPAALFVNGTFAGLSGDIDIDMILPLDGVEAAEIYRPGESVFEFRSPGGRQCGIISLWSRLSQPDTTGAIRHLALALHTGARLGSGGLRDGRLGLALSYTIKNAVEFYPAINIYTPVPSTAGNPIQTGVQIILALRVRPLGQESPWYLGTGLAFANVSGQPTANPADVRDSEGQFPLILTGLLLSHGAWQPYVELQLVDPVKIAGAQNGLFVGLARRFY